MRATMRKRGGIGAPRIDPRHLAEAVKGPGVDTRRWISAGTVGTRDEGGEFSTTGFVAPKSGPDVPEATFADEQGCYVDVRLEPTGDIVTAMWSGIGAGRFGKMLFPIRSGDNVLVAIPDGDLNSPDITIFAMNSDPTAKIPTDWNNDRVLFEMNVPFEIRGPSVSIRSPLLTLNGRFVGASPEGI